MMGIVYNIYLPFILFKATSIEQGQKIKMFYNTGPLDSLVVTALAYKACCDELNFRDD